MPELPDILSYIKALETRVNHRVLARVRLQSAFVLRTAVPPITTIEGSIVQGLRRLGKRIVLEFEQERFLVIHLMIAGRLQWREAAPAKIGGKLILAAFDFEGSGTLLFTEASTKKRASMHLVEGPDALDAFDRGGLEVLEADFESFAAAFRSENHTVKRSLTDPRLLSGIGNAYSDEILHCARLSPFKQTENLSDEEMNRLFVATQETLKLWIDRLDPGEGFPTKVTAFHPEMAVHGKYNQPCPVCGSLVQRVVYADNESNYCPTCQLEGRLLADRGLSRLLKTDWPRSLEELEAHKASRKM